MTPAQARIRDSIAALTSEGLSPSMRQVMTHAGLSSVATVAKAYDHLEREGVIYRDPTRRRSVVLLDPDAHWSAKVLERMTDDRLSDLIERAQDVLWSRCVAA